MRTGAGFGGGPIAFGHAKWCQDFLLWTLFSRVRRLGRFDLGLLRAFRFAPGAALAARTLFRGFHQAVVTASFVEVDNFGCWLGRTLCWRCFVGLSVCGIRLVGSLFLTALLVLLLLPFLTFLLLALRLSQHAQVVLSVLLKVFGRDTVI